MRQAVICLDVGGTEIKAAVLQQDGTLLTDLQHFPSHSDQNANALVAHFTSVIACLAQQTPAHTITALCLAFPGPFDYENGICLLQGLAKYDALYGINLHDALLSSLRVCLGGHLHPSFGVYFVNDVGAFALGELHYGSAKGSERALYVCIGTGCGSAFSVGDTLAPKDTLNVPPNGYLYNQPFRDTCIDDYLSRRGICALSQIFLGHPADGYALAQEVSLGNADALACFEAFSLLLQEALTPFLDTFRPDVLVLGGQITRSAHHFDAALRKACTARGISLSLSDNTSLRTVQGLLSIKPKNENLSEDFYVTQN